MKFSPPIDTDIDPGIKRYWFGDLGPDGWNPANASLPSLLERMKLYQPDFCIRPSWTDAVSCGFCKDQGEYFSILRDLCIAWSKDEIKAYSISDEARLIQLILVLRETDLMISRVSEQITLWGRMTEYDRADNTRDKKGCVPLRRMADQGSDGISLICHDLLRMKDSRLQLAQDISMRSESLLPNCSALVGPLVAARLLAEAGSLHRLSRMPGSAIQILGAKNAFFSHRRTGSPPPKHGLIFEHKRVHVAPRKVRGRVARTLAANLAVAARIDYYRGLPDSAFLSRADSRINTAGKK